MADLFTNLMTILLDDEATHQAWMNSTSEWSRLVYLHKDQMSAVKFIVITNYNPDITKRNFTPGDRLTNSCMLMIVKKFFDGLNNGSVVYVQELGPEIFMKQFAIFDFIWSKIARPVPPEHSGKYLTDFNDLFKTDEHRKAYREYVRQLVRKIMKCFPNAEGILLVGANSKAQLFEFKQTDYIPAGLAVYCVLHPDFYFKDKRQLNEQEVKTNDDVILAISKVLLSSLGLASEPVFGHNFWERQYDYEKGLMSLFFKGGPGFPKYHVGPPSENEFNAWCLLRTRMSLRELDMCDKDVFLMNWWEPLKKDKLLPDLSDVPRPYKGTVIAASKRRSDWNLIKEQQATGTFEAADPARDAWMEQGLTVQRLGPLWKHSFKRHNLGGSEAQHIRTHSEPKVPLYDGIANHSRSRSISNKVPQFFHAVLIPLSYRPTNVITPSTVCFLWRALQGESNWDPQEEMVKKFVNGNRNVKKCLYVENDTPKRWMISEEGLRAVLENDVWLRNVHMPM